MSRAVTMQAMVLDAPRRPLRLTDKPLPVPGPGAVLLRVTVCGLCRTDLHLVDGELPNPKPQLIPGHQIVGRIVERGANASRFQVGDRVGVPWLGFADGTCEYCRRGQENLCPQARFTGYQQDGGFAEYTVADERFCLPLPDGYDDREVAPLLCAGLIGYRALRMAGEAPRLGLYGFGASAHLVAQLARHRGQRVFAFVRKGDEASAAFARSRGAEWAGDSLQPAPEPLDAAIIFAPAGELVPAALRAVAPGGTVVCAGIHMSDIPSFPYEILWGERVLRSVANLTRRDGTEFLEIAPRIPIHTDVEVHRLSEVNVALDRLRRGDVLGAAVIEI
ncbi:MAG TPA: zinc-dependent alcohol dehydrogenase family protein [Candidatus Limnocylindrales bacterium]|nr:zinc-dependent alcohol dehydrogenase family protein [Candidatus Limnocylindrales bacterium]